MVLEPGGGRLDPDPAVGRDRPDSGQPGQLAHDGRGHGGREPGDDRQGPGDLPAEAPHGRLRRGIGGRMLLDDDPERPQAPRLGRRIPGHGAHPGGHHQRRHGGNDQRPPALQPERTDDHPCPPLLPSTDM
jgi:hypothetical protein